MAGTLTWEMAGDTAVMGANATGQQLHDRATRGETLTEAEQGSLASWYERQDAEEAALLGASAPMTEAALRHLRGEVEAASARMLAATQAIQAQVAENERLRQEIAALTQRLAQSASSQPA